MVTNRIIFFATSVQPNPEEIDYWVDLSDNPYGGSIKYFNGTEWVRLAASGGMPDLSNYYTKTQVNKLLNDKANISDVDSKVDDKEVKDVIKDIQFNTSNPNGITMVMFKYDGSNDSISLPIASTGSAGIVTSKDFLDFVKQHQLQELHTEMIDTFADIRAKYQKKLIAGLNIEIDQETNVISASGDLAVQWDNITGKPDFKPVATSGDYNDLINKLKPGKDVSISEDNTISIAIDSDSLEQSLATLQSNIDKEAATARAAETKLGNDIATEKNRAQSAEQTISTNLQNEINRSTQVDTQHTNAINKEVQDRKEAIATEVSDRNAAILVETNRAKAKEEELDNKITDHTAATNAALALKADKSDTYTKAQVDAKLSGAYKVKGSSTFEALPKDNNVVGDVYNIINAFNLGGKHYDAGTNVVWTEDGWDALSGSFDTTAIEGSIQEVADNLAQEILDRTQADTTINNNVSSLTNRVKVNEDKLTIINGNESTTGSIANAIKQAKSYTDTTVTAEQTRAEAAEQKLTGDLASEITRAKGAESANATAIANEIERATGVEDALNNDVNQLYTQKVDKVEGKGLSTNDYTTAEKQKLAGIEANANNYTLPKASSSVLGGVKTGSNITNTDGTISLTKANVTSALGVDPTTTYVKKAGDTMTGSLTIETTSDINLYSNVSVPSSRWAVVRLKSGDEFWDVTTKYGSGFRIQKQGQATTELVVDNSGNVTNTGYLKSKVATGTAPIQVSSTTLCTNLNADMIDGKNVIENGTTSGLDFTKRYTDLTDSQRQVWIKLATLQLPTDNLYGNKQIAFEIIGGNDIKHNTINYASLVASTREITLVKLVMQQSVGVEFIAGYVTTSTNVEIWLGCLGGWNNTVTVTCKFSSNASDILTSRAVTTRPNNFVLGEIVTLDAPDWYGVSWSETSSNPDCTRIGNMDMHRSLPIQSMMKGYKVTTKQGNLPYMLRKLEDDWSKTIGGYYGGTHDNNFNGADTNIMVLIPEFWWIDDYSPSSKTHNLKICPHAKPGWNHHKEAFVGAYEGILTNDSFYSRKGVVPSVNVTREKLRTAARNNGNANEYKWNIYTYNEHRAICHLFLVEYATRNSQKAVNTELTPEGFRQGGLGSGCTTGTATINGAQTWSFIPTGSSDSLGSGSGEVTVTIQQTDQSGSNTSTITRKCNRYRGIENPFGHIWKHTDDIISKYSIVSGKGYRSWSICENPINFSTNLTTKYTPICIEPVVTGYKTEIVITPTCDFFAHACTNGSESTYWCDYNWDNTDTSEHCLLIGGRSDSGGTAGLFALYSHDGVGSSAATIGSRLTYLPWAE